jgi:hypothetical protein
MKMLLSSCCILFFSINMLCAQPVAHDSVLIRRIDTMFRDDQFWRKEYFNMLNKKSAYDQKTIERKWAQADSINELKAKAIVARYGFPGFRLAGDRTNSFWAIVQHCDDDIPFQEKILKLMKAKLKSGDADKQNYAYLVDRVLVNKHQKQVYGTQVRTDPKTGVSAPFPVADPQNLDKRRKSMGLQPISEYLKSFK